MVGSDLKPYLKWAGGKRQLLPEIRKHLPEDIQRYTYYEPFVGAGAVFFDLQPKKAVINDYNTQLILTYQVIKTQCEALIQALQEYARNNNKAYYYQIRDLDRDSRSFQGLSDVEKAARLIFLNKTCYNGLYRVNRRGLFNTPYGNYKNPAICEEQVLKRISAYLNANEVAIMNHDFEAVLSSVQDDSFIYFDPPYHSPQKTNFTAYQAVGFGEEEQERLRNVFTAAAGLGAKCLLSNGDTLFIRELYKNFKIQTVQAKRVINADPSRRGLINEVLIKSW
ncbi:MAG: DNA adenine methylase [Treponema sp.]|nr:DNA adenine methylase [Treponema sp.]